MPASLTRKVLREAVEAARRRHGHYATLEIYLGDAEVLELESINGKLTWPTRIWGMRTYHVDQPSYLRVRSPSGRRTDS